MAALALASCEETKKAAPAPAPAKVAFDPAWIPAHGGKGNFVICLSTAATPDEVQSVTVPRNVIFQSWGPLHASILEQHSGDERALRSDATSKALTSYAVITTEPVTLTQTERCWATPVRAVLRESYGWTHPAAPASLHYSYQAEITATPDSRLKPIGSPEHPSMFWQAMQGGVLNGALVADAGDPVEIQGSAETP